VIYHRLKDEFDRDPRPEVSDGPWGLVDFSTAPIVGGWTFVIIEYDEEMRNRVNEEM